MKKVSKLLSMLLLVTMCLGLMGGMSAFAGNSTVYVKQTAEPALNGTVTYEITCADPAEVASCTLTYGGRTWDAPFTVTGNVISIYGDDWSTSVSMDITFVNGDTATVAWGMDNVGSTTITVPDPTPTPAPTATPTPAPTATPTPAPTATPAPHSDLTTAPSGASFEGYNKPLTFTLQGGHSPMDVFVDGNAVDAFYSKNSVQLNSTNIIAAGGEGKSQYTITIIATDGCTIDVTVVNNTIFGGDNQTNNGVEQTPTITYLQKSGNSVAFDITAAPDSIRVYDMVDHAYVNMVAGDYTVDATYNGLGVKFSNAFLDTKLIAGRTYQIACVYGTGSGQGVTIGYIKVGTTSTTVDNSLWFTNSNTSDNTVLRYYSGSIAPEMCSGIFLVDGGYLQYSTNGGASWALVGIEEYFIRLTDSGERTQYAFLKDSFLNKLTPDTIYYFRAFLPANKSNTGLEVHSNSIQLITGAALKYVDTDKHVINSTKNLQFRSSQQIAKVYVGNVELTDPNFFSVSNDKKTVTLSPEFLNGRTAGQTYTITVLTTQGEKLSTTFKILTTAQAASSPKTGDSSDLGLWIAAMILSGGAAAIALPRMKKIGSK